MQSCRARAAKSSFLFASFFEAVNKIIFIRFSSLLSVGAREYYHFRRDITLSRFDFPARQRRAGRRRH